MIAHATKRHTANAPTMIRALYRDLQRPPRRSARAHGRQPHTRSAQAFDTARASLRAHPDLKVVNVATAASPITVLFDRVCLAQRVDESTMYLEHPL